MNTNSNDDDSLPLSVVVIAENEEDRIGACLQSVIEAARNAVPAFEIILVDSGSTDHTVHIASEFPVSIYRIPTEHVVSCGAGRYVGDHFARGELVLHVDGDMRLTENWLGAAVDYLQEHEDVAAVEGELNESVQHAVVDVDKVGGVMLFDADALRSVRGFDPYLLGYEDIDVGFRLSAAGFRLVRLPMVSADHPSGGAFSEPIRRWRSGFYFAPGQAIRKSRSSPRILTKLLARQRYKGALLVWLGLGILALGTGVPFLAWLLLSLAGSAFVVSRLGLSRGFQFIAGKTLGLIGLVRGLLIRPQPPETYPVGAVEVVAEGAVISGHERASKA